MTIAGTNRAWHTALRVLGLLPVILIIGRYEYTHAFGGTMPIPFIAMFAAVVVAAIVGGRLTGLTAGLLVAGEVLHCHLRGIGPAPLTALPGNVLLGSVIFCSVGFLLGWLRDRLDQTIGQLAQHRTGLEADLEAEKEQSLSDKARHEARLATALRLARLGHFEFETATGTCSFCSRRHASHFGLTTEEFMKQTEGFAPALAFVHPDDRQIVREAIRRIRSGQEHEFEYRAQQANGEVRFIREIVAPEFDVDGTVIREVGTSLDLTDLRRAEATLLESQKLEAVGQLTAGVAHDFNNLLAVIMGNLELLKEAESPDEEAEMIAAALGATERGAALTRKLLSFGRKSMLNPEPLDLCMSIKELGTLFRRTLPASIEIALPCTSGDCIASIDRAQFESAILNLVVNASDAMPSGGSLKIHGKTETLDAATVARRGLALESGTYIGISVTDTGTGMTDDVRAHALEPFFSTKEVGKGSGLGLPMVLGFTKQSGGDVEIDSAPGKGTTITLHFKAAPGALPGCSTGKPEFETAPGSGALILLVEDDASVRAVVSRQIAALGYRVLEAEDARAAMAILEARDDVALMLSDIVMPGKMQGTDLLRAAAALKPSLKCILMSGYHGMPSGADIDLPPDVPRLTKPISRDELRDCRAMSHPDFC